MSRTDFTQLPQSDELEKIIKLEEERPVPSSKIGKHFVNFGPAISLLKIYGLPWDFFIMEADSDDAKGGILEQGNVLLKELSHKILLSPPTEKQLLALSSSYAYLREEDALIKADLIMVFGGKGNLRIEKAIELYKAGMAPRMILSGGHPAYNKDVQSSEAERFNGLAIAAGIPHDSLIVEPESITVADNVRRSLNRLDGLGLEYRNVILVNSPYVQRRGWAFFMKYAPDGVYPIRINSATAKRFQLENWYTSHEGLSAVLNEFVKLKIAVALDTA